jgi:hypothetical protein
MWPTTATDIVTDTNASTSSEKENGTHNNNKSVHGMVSESTSSTPIGTVASSSSSSSSAHSIPHWVFMFALRVQDETATADVILFDKEAEFFLGVTAAEYVTNEVIRKEVFTRLQFLMDAHSTNTIVELFLQSYHSMEKRSQRTVKRLAVLETDLSDAQM